MTINNVVFFYRNRKKKTDDISKLVDFPHEESDDNMTLDRWR